MATFDTFQLCASKIYLFSVLKSVTGDIRLVYSHELSLVLSI